MKHVEFTGRRRRRGPRTLRRGSLIALTALALGCSSADDTSTQSGAGGQGDGPDGQSGDCDPATCLDGLALHPPGCAEAACEHGACVLRATDADMDGQRSMFCKDTSGKAQVEVGTDCDDGNPLAFAGAWDGPGGDGHEDRCDGIDQSCNGVADEDPLMDGTSCACKPGAIAECSETSSGKPIEWPTGAPVGECRLGSKTCEQDASTGGGRWGPCVGAVEPALEECNGKDDDCDGEADEDSADPIEWTCDVDSDGHLSPNSTTVTSCATPAQDCIGTWRSDAPKDDCDDARPDIYAGAPELCDGSDNDCNGSVDDNPVNPTTWYLDADLDGYGDASTASKVQCDAPTQYWRTYDALGGNTNTDCNDGNASINPGKWDGPGKLERDYGIKAPGWQTEIFQLQPPTSCGFACTAQLADDAFATGTPLVTRNDLVLEFNWSAASADPSAPQLMDYFAVRSSGELEVKTSGDYTFSAQGNNGVRVKVDGAVAIESWDGGTNGWTYSAQINLQAGVHDIEVEHYETRDYAYLYVYWDGPDFGESALRAVHDPVGGPASDSCDGVDNDCSGQPDDAVARDVAMPALSYGCVDSPSECDPWAYGNAILTVSCMDPTPTPPDGTPCHAGMSTCLLSGTWSACVGWTHAQPFDTCDNNVDDDCNGVVDDSSGNTTWYYDGDKDGYRCSGASCPPSVVQCTDPGLQWVQWDAGDPVDCNDNNAAIHPGAAERCGDSVDQNCDGNNNDGFPDLGKACSAGTQNTCCYREGTIICNGGTDTKCSVTAGTPSSAFHTSRCTAPIPDEKKWDWDCSGTVEKQYADGIDYVPIGGTAGEILACTTGTCESQNEYCLFGELTCGDACGQSFHVARCNGYIENNQHICDYLGSSPDLTQACK